jgi:hypothetical protein
MRRAGLGLGERYRDKGEGQERVIFLSARAHTAPCRWRAAWVAAAAASLGPPHRRQRHDASGWRGAADRETHKGSEHMWRRATQVGGVLYGLGEYGGVSAWVRLEVTHNTTHELLGRRQGGVLVERLESRTRGGHGRASSSGSAGANQAAAAAASRMCCRLGETREAGDGGRRSGMWCTNSARHASERSGAARVCMRGHCAGPWSAEKTRASAINICPTRALGQGGLVAQPHEACETPAAATGAVLGPVGGRGRSSGCTPRTRGRLGRCIHCGAMCACPAAAGGCAGVASA